MLKLPWATHLYGALAHDDAAVRGEAFQVPSCHMVTNDGKVLQGHVHVVAYVVCGWWKYNPKIL